MRSVIKQIIAGVIVTAVPMIASAQAIPVGKPGNLPGSPAADAQSLVAWIIVGLLLPIAGIIAILFLIIGGFQYMFAGVNEDLAKRGKSTIRNAIVGLIVIILSYVIVTVVVNTLSD